MRGPLTKEEASVLVPLMSFQGFVICFDATYERFPNAKEVQALVNLLNDSDAVAMKLLTGEAGG